MKKHFLLLIIFFFAGCSSSEKLDAGVWSGALTPMNHPEMENPVGYEVSYEGQVLDIIMLGPNNTHIPLQKPELRSDTLFFSFNEPEEQVLLTCALGKNSRGFAGKCVDPSGKWAQFTMIAPG